MRGRNKVAITGLGLVAPNGIGVDEFWSSLVAGESGIGPITLFDSSDFPIKIAGEVKGFDIQHFTNDDLKPRRLGRHTQLALAATRLALQDAGIDYRNFAQNEHGAVIIGVSSSAFDVIEQGKDRMSGAGLRHVSPFVVSASQPNAIANIISGHLGANVHVETVSSACTAGLIAITRAAEMISSGKIDIALCGGSDAPVSPFAVASFAASGMVPLEQGDPARASRPFDLNRAGGVMSEGAAMVVLESLAHARAHGRDPKVMLTGFGQSIDAPGSPPASGLAESMQKAISNAGLYESEIQYICAHAPSDPLMDKVETAAIKNVFGQRAYEMAVSSIKGVTGNPLSAAGPMSLAACVKAVQEGYLPPTANYETPDPDCDLDCVPNRSRVASVRKAMVNIHEMGGGNCSIVLEALNGS